MKVVKLENKKLTEEELRSNQNLHKPEEVQTQVDVPYGVARDEDTVAQEHAEEVFDELEKNAEGITPKDPDDGGVKIEKNAYSEPIALDESLFTEDADDDNEIAKFLKDSVEWLIEQDEGCSTYKLNGRLGICVGWQDGYDPEDELAIHSATSPQYAIVAGIKVYTSDDMRTDYDWINYPYFANGEVVDDSVTIEPTENYDKLARYFSKEFDAMKDWEIEEDGLVIKSDDWEDDDVEESLSPKHRRKVRESKKHNLEPRKRTAPDGKVWWVAYDTDSKKYSTITTIGKYENKKDCQYAIDKYNKLNESKSLKEGASNFWSMEKFPLLVFGDYEDTYDEVEQLAIDSIIRDKGEDYDYDDDELDQAMENAWDEWDKYNGYCLLDQFEANDLGHDIDVFNRDLKNKYYEDHAEELDGYEDAKIELKPGYYEAYQIFVPSEKYLADWQVEEINDFLKAEKEKYYLTELGVAWRASNGETGYNIKEAVDQRKLLDAVKDAYGFTTKEAKEWIRKANDKQKELIIKGFEGDAKKSFLNDSLKENDSLSPKLRRKVNEASDTVSLDDMISSYNGSVNDIASDAMLIDRSGDTYKVSLNDVRELNGVYPEDGNDALLNKKIKFINDYVSLYNSDDNLFVEISSDVMPTDTQLNKLFDCIDEFMRQHRGVSKVYVDWRFTAGGGTNLTAGRSPKVLRDKITAAIKSHNFKGVNESKELTEKKGKVEGEDDNVYQLVYDALFLGNKNFRPHIADEAGSVYDWEQSLIMLPGYNDYDLGIALEKEEDGKYAKAVADKLGLKYEIKPTSSLSDGYKFIATVRIPDEIANKDATEYVTSIGLDMDTIRPKRKGKK